jgi:hypothetical protein
MRRKSHGQAMVEFALVLPLLLLLLFGMIHFGKALNYWNDATHLSAEAARFAMVNRKPDPASAAWLQAQIRAQIDSPELRNGGTESVASPAKVCVEFPNDNPKVGDWVRVRVIFTYAWLPLIGNQIGAAQTTVAATSTMRLEAPPTNYSAGCA